MAYGDFLKSLFPDSYNTDQEIMNALLGAKGALFDALDPNNENHVLAYEFSVTKATGSALDKHGQDWGVQRRSGESDDDFRKRILGELPFYTLGPTVAGIKAATKPFTGQDPIVFEYGPNAFVIGESRIGEAGFCTQSDLFSFEVWVQNPSNFAYNHSDLENAVQMIKLARSTAIIYHNGSDTSIKNEASNATITVQ